MAQPRFEFRLQTLLDHRARIEKDHQRKVAEIQQQISQLMNQIQSAQQQIREQDAALAGEKLTGRLDLQYIAYEKRFVGNLHVRIVLTMQRLAGVEKTLAAAKAELLEAAKAKKVLVKLREKHHARWLADLERKETALLDEVGTQLAIRSDTDV